MSAPIEKVVIPVAGLGTRVLPASKAIPKEMLPVVDKPIIQHVVEEAIEAGFKQIILVTRSGKSAIEDHFDHSYELADTLERKGKTALLKSICDMLPAGVSLSMIRQDKPLGLGHAVHCAAPLVADAPFAVMLPDVLVKNSAQQQRDMTRMVEAFKLTGRGQIMVEPVEWQAVERYGVADCQGVVPEPGQSVQLTAMVEKPPREQAPSNLAIAGRYILPARVMALLADTPAGAGGEIQLTDALEQLLTEQSLEAYLLAGDIHDCGNKIGLLTANLVYGLEHPETAEAMRDLIKKLHPST